MSNFDDLAEHKRRLKTALALSPFLGWASCAALLTEQMGDPLRLTWWETPSTWVILAPFVLGWALLIYRLCPVKNGRMGTAAQGAPPRLWRQGNPAIRQPNGAFSALMLCGALSVLGCVGVFATTEGDLVGVALPMMYIGLGLICLMMLAQARWIELDIDSLRIIRHSIVQGLQVSEVQSEREAVRALGVCRGAYGGPYKIFAFCRDGSAIPLTAEQSDLKQIQFEGERLADQLMVPLLRGMENQSPEAVARHLRSLADEKLPVRQDWAAVTMPPELAQHRSTYPPVD